MAQDASFAMVESFKLPVNFKNTYTNIIILVPENYGHGGCFRDIFIDPDLELLNKNGTDYRKMDTDIHGFRRYPYASMSDEMKKIFQDKNWFYLCLHDKNPDSSIINYLDKVKLFLGNPYKNWKAIFEGYK